MNFYIGDPHLGHEAIIRLCNRPFADVDEMDEAIISNWNSRVTNGDMDALIEEQLSKEQPPPEPDAQESAEADNDTPEGDDTIAMAMALLVIENTHLREVIRNLRDTISGLTDHKLL